MRRRSSEQSPLTRLKARTGRRYAPGLRPRALLLLGFASGLVLMAAQPAAAQSEGTTGRAECPADLNTVPSTDTVVRFVKVAGLIDPAVRDYMLDQLDQAEADPDTVGYVLWMNSNGSVLGDDDYLQLATRLRESPVETALWVGNTGSTAQGGAAELATVVDLVAVTPNSTIGRTGDRRLPADWGSAFGEAATRLETGVFTANQAIEAGISVGPLENTVPIGSFATMLSGIEVFECVTADGALATVPTTQQFLSGLPLSHQLFHTVASPEVAYLLFVMGMAIIVFELYVAGVGIAGVIGAGSLLLGSYGLAVLPVNWWALALLLLAMFFLAIDIQTNVPRFYTILGLVCFVARYLVPVRRRVPVVDHGVGRDHRRRPVRVYGDAVDGPHPVLHPDDRPQVDDRRTGGGSVGRRPGGIGEGSRRCVAGRSPTGPRRYRRGSRSGSSGSIVSSSKSSRRRARRGTIGSVGPDRSAPEWRSTSRDSQRQEISVENLSTRFLSSAPEST